MSSTGLFVRMRPWIAALALLSFVSITSAGCYGRFEALRRVYRFNGGIHANKWIVWGAFLAMNIIPIYGVATLLDTLILNSLEFWTGRNPLLARAGTSQVALGPHGERVMVTYQQDGAIEYDVVDASGARQYFRFVREESSVVALDAEGRVLMRVGERDGLPAVLQD